MAVSAASKNRVPSVSECATHFDLRHFGLRKAARIALALAAVFASAASAADKTAWQAPRTADGHPDLQGVWTSATITPLERPDEFGERRALTVAEAAKLENAESSLVSNSAKPTDLTKALPGDCREFGRGCGYNNFWLDRGSQVVTVDGEKRTSLLIDPPNGKIPALVPERASYMATRMQQMRQNYDGPEARPLGERCLLAFGSSSGPPMLPVLYNNHYQIVQNKDTVVILVEMVHDARVIRLGGKHLPSTVRKWMGDSIGRWEGDTLVVETTNFTEQESFRGTTSNARMVERFTRVAPDRIHYRFTVEDPSAFTRPFTGEMPFHLTDDMIYEYACHEGNYALPGVLAGAREQEKRAAN
jgi:hypothetical protein